MSRVNEILQNVMRKKYNSVAPAAIKDTQASSLSKELNAFEQMFTQHIGRLNASIKNEAKDAEEVFATFRENTTMLENKLEETVNSARMKESASQKMVENLTGQIRALEEVLKKNQKTLLSRDAEINDLKSHVQFLSRGIKEVSSFFKEAEALTSLDQPSDNVVPKEPTNGLEEKPAGAELKGPVVVNSKAADAAPQKVPPDFFESVTRELTESIGPMAPMIIHDHVAALGESMEKFPNSRVRELLDTLSAEILDENRKARFRMYFAKQMREGDA